MVRLSKISSGPRATAQRGAVLIVALIALVIMSLAGISLVRSVDTANEIAGNMAFKKSSTSMTDLGVQIAFNTLTAVANRNDDAVGTTALCPYLASMTNTLNWTTVTPVTTGVPAGYQLRCVIDRLCQDVDGIAGINDKERECLADPRTTGNSKGEPGVDIYPVQIIYYRIRVQVTGPRNTVSEAQATVSS